MAEVVGVEVDLGDVGMEGGLIIVVRLTMSLNWVCLSIHVKEKLSASSAAARQTTSDWWFADLLILDSVFQCAYL